MSETKTTETPKEVVKGDGENFVKKAAAADKKPVKKTGGKKPTGKKPTSEKPAEKKAGNSDGKDKPQKKPLTRAQIAERKFGVESTWRPFEIWARAKGLVKEESKPEEKK